MNGTATAFTLLRTFLAQLLRPAALTQEQIEAIVGKGGTPTYFATLGER